MEQQLQIMRDRLESLPFDRLREFCFTDLELNVIVIDRETLVREALKAIRKQVELKD